MNISAPRRDERDTAELARAYRPLTGEHTRRWRSVSQSPFPGRVGAVTAGALFSRELTDCGYQATACRPIRTDAFHPRRHPSCHGPDCYASRRAQIGRIGEALYDMAHS